MNSKQDVSLNKTYIVLKILVLKGAMTVAAVSQVFDVINPEFETGSLDTESRKAGQSKELSKRLFICPAGSWTAVPPIGTIQSGRHTDGRSRVTVLALESLPAFWCRSGWHQGMAGLSNGREGITQ